MKEKIWFNIYIHVYIYFFPGYLFQILHNNTFSPHHLLSSLNWHQTFPKVPSESL